MKVLVIILSHEMNSINSSNINILNNYLKKYEDSVVDYCGISNSDDFYNYENIISFKYKIINPKQQFSKICDFITQYKAELDYDWFIKIRPDIKLLEPINFEVLSDTAINARARVYEGPQSIKYGMSVNGEGGWSTVGDCFYNVCEKRIILDDMIYIFHNNVVNLGAFDIIYPGIMSLDEIIWETEWLQTRIWKSRNICLNIIGVWVVNTKYNCTSGHLLSSNPI